ncbi:MAG: tetratricopeptide repeat protein [Myxococcales bacterium]|nr:tetratricopeptide repeat protein [Myxococcota bacterium]MDW8284004.1 tetratricopeptide repeat protein [Myxococcales bacterium]
MGIASRTTSVALIALLVGSIAGQAHAQGRAGAETEEERIFSEAEAAFNAGRYAEAAPLYDRALALNPNRPASLVKRATLHFRERRYDQAIALLLRAERLSPDDIYLKTILGLCLYQSGQQARGLRYLEEVIARRPEAYEAQLQIGQHYAQLKPARAILALELFLRYRPEEQRALDAVARLHLGQAYFLRGRLREAQEALEAALQARPRDVQIQLSLAAVVLARGDFARAARLYEPLIPEIPRRPRVAYNLALAYLHLGRTAEANRLAVQYAELRPQDPRGRILLGDVALSGGKDPDVRAALYAYKEAARLARSASPADQPRVSLEARLARAYLVGNDPGRAFAEAEQALARLDRSGGEQERPGGIPEPEVELLSVLIEAAIEEVRRGNPPRPGLTSMAARLVEILPQDAGALSLAGNAALVAGELDRARRLYSDALAVDGRNPRARTGLAHTLNRIALQGIDAPGGAAAAIPLLEQALPLDDSPRTARNLAVAYLLQGRPLDAERVLQRALAGIGRGDPVLLRLRARAVLALRPAEALAAYEQALAEASPPRGEGTEGTEGPAALAELRAELGARYLQVGRLDEAIDVLEGALRDMPGSALEDRQAARRNLSLAYLARGRSRLRECEAQAAQGQPAVKLAEAALDDLQRSLDRGGLAAGRREVGAALCAAALAATQATRYPAARQFLERAQTEGGCDLVPPYDRLGMDLLLAFVSYRDATSPAQRERAVRLVPKLLARGGAPLQALLRPLLRSAQQMLAYDLYAAGKTRRAAQLLRASVQTMGRGEDADPVLQHNLAVLDLIEGRGAAERTLERLGGRPPEALVNLGLLRDRRGEPKKALELYRRALEKGARVPRLREWIDVKERLLGGGS